MPSATSTTYVPPKVYAEFRGEHKSDMTATLYNINVNEKNELYAPKSQTVPALFQNTVDNFGWRNAVGHRKILERKFVPANPDDPTGRQFEKLTLASEYSWRTYTELAARIHDLAQGLAKFHEIKPQGSIGIYAETQEDWMTMAHAAWSMNLKVTTVYATLGPDAAAFGLRQANCDILVCDHAMMKNMPKILALAKCVKSVVVIGSENVTIDGVNTECLEKLVEDGKNVTEKTTFTAPTGDDIAVVMYTSGTTGNPKGVLVRHAALTCQAEAAVQNFPKIDEKAIHIAYLPLAHIMEMVMELGFLSLGACAAFSSSQTLTQSGAKLAPGVVCDAVVAKPTVFLFAPAVLDKVYNKVGAGISEARGPKKMVAEKALASGLKNQANHKVGAAAFWYTIGFKKMAQLVGGKVELALCGSAPLSPAVQRFCQTVLRAPLRQGYGLTETLASSCIMDAGDNSTNTVGPPTICSTIRLRDWPEGGYLVADKDNAEIGMPRGEILIGGNGLSDGYLVNPDDEDAEKMRQKNLEEYIVVDGERFFCTGDIGQITSAGNLMIVDRKKDLFKGSTGEYVSLSKVESVMKVSKYVDIPFVYGKTGEDSVVALISPMVSSIEELANALDIDSEMSIFNLLKHKDIHAAVKADLNATLKELKSFEKPTAFRMVLHEQDGEALPAFSPENEMMTAAMKMKRPVVARAFADVITEAYEESKKIQPKEAEEATKKEIKKAKKMKDAALKAERKNKKVEANMTTKVEAEMGA